MSVGVRNWPQRVLSSLQAAIRAIKALRGQPDGFVGTDPDGFATTTHLGSGTPTSSMVLRGDGVWAASPGVVDGDYGDISITGGVWTTDKAGGIEYVSTYAELTAAVTAMTSGGIIHIAPGTYTLTSTLTLPNANLTLRGSGKDVTTLRYTADYNTDIIRIRHGGIAIEDMTIQHGTTTGNGYGGVGSGRGIVIDAPSSVSDNFTGIALRRLNILNTGSWAIYDTGLISYEQVHYTNGFSSAGGTLVADTAEHPYPVLGFHDTIGASYSIATTTNGTTTVASVVLFGNVRVGQYVTGTGVTHGTYVTAKASNSSITVSDAITAGTPTLTFANATACGITVEMLVEDVTTAFTNSGGACYFGSGGTTVRVVNLKTNNYSFGSFTRYEAASAACVTLGAVHFFNHYAGTMSGAIFQSPTAQSGGEPVSHSDVDATMLSFHQTNTMQLYSPYWEVLSQNCAGGVDWRIGLDDGRGTRTDQDAYGYRQYWLITGGGCSNIVFNDPWFGCTTKKLDPTYLSGGVYYEGFPARLVRSLDDAGGFGFEMRGGRVAHWRLKYGGGGVFPAASAPFASGDFAPVPELSSSTSNPWDDDDFLLAGDDDGTDAAPILIENLDIVNYVGGGRRAPTAPSGYAVWNHEAFRIRTDDRNIRTGFWTDRDFSGGTASMDDPGVRIPFSQPLRGGTLVYSSGSTGNNGANQREGYWGIAIRPSDNNWRQIPWIRVHTSAYPSPIAADLWMRINGSPSSGVYPNAEFCWYSASAWQAVFGLPRTTTAAGDLAYYSATDTPARLPIGNSGEVLRSSGTAPAWIRPLAGLTLTGNLPIVGDDAPAVAAGSLGKVDLTGQAADITTTNLSNTPPAGFYEVEVYLLCTTADVTAGALAVTIGWTDNVGATTSTPITGFTLAATGRTTGRQMIRTASGNITYAVTITGAYGTAQYAVYARVVALG